MNESQKTSCLMLKTSDDKIHKLQFYFYKVQKQTDLTNMLMHVRYSKMIIKSKTYLAKKFG